MEVEERGEGEREKERWAGRAGLFEGGNLRVHPGWRFATEIRLLMMTDLAPSDIRH